MDKTMLVPMNVSSGAALMKESRPAGLGMIGLGPFGRFCLEAYLQMPEVQVVAIADPDSSMLAAGGHLAPFAAAHSDALLLLARPEVDVVHICTPPDRHLAIVLAAILAGKHVICEKPLGISLLEFDTAVAAAARHGVVLGINLVLRHDPLYQAVQALARSSVLGRPHCLAVENYADEALVCGPEHWLWNPARSGGLALAVDIHWLDLATRLLGPARAIHAWQPTAKEGAAVVPRRLVTTTHPAGAVASVYHAFDTRSDATGCTVLIAFEEGEARVEGWIPRQLTIACPADRLKPVATLLGATACPTVATGDDNQVTVALNARSDRHSAYLGLIQTTLRQLLAEARGQATTGMNLTAARTATATAGRRGGCHLAPVGHDRH